MAPLGKWCVAWSAIAAALTVTAMSAATATATVAVWATAAAAAVAWAQALHASPYHLSQSKYLSPFQNRLTLYLLFIQLVGLFNYS